MTRMWACWIVAVGCLLHTPVATAEETAAQDDTSAVAKVERSVVTRNGLRFNVPADWPIEQHGSAVGPISVEDYIVRKFKLMQSRMEADEQRLGVLERRLKALESRPRHQTPKTVDVTSAGRVPAKTTHAEPQTTAPQTADASPSTPAAPTATGADAGSPSTTTP